MKQGVLRWCALGLALSAGVASAKTAHIPKSPILVEEGYAESQGFRAKYQKMSNMSSDGKAAIKEQRIVSVPTWNGSFTTAGAAFPFTMVGGDPRKGDTTRVGTQLIVISFFFDEFVDGSGNNIVIDAAPIVPAVKNGPDFDDFAYGTGTTQFADAVQRAEFFSVMKKDWHTRISDPAMLTPVQIEVPFGQSLVFQAGPGGPIFALIDFDFYISQLNTIIQLEPLDVKSLPVVLTRNGLFFEGGDPNNCCVLGFHTAFETKVVANKHFVQTFATASWVDPGIFVNPDIADVLPLSHEISEWMDDPFINNVVPPWQFPGFNVCGGNILETGDPVEVLDHPAFPVFLNGFLYHPQTEALLQWFSRETPSSAFQGAYSYPDMTTLPTPSVACAP